MLRAAWKSLLGRKVRLLMSAFAIVLGTAFVAGSLVFTDVLGKSFDGIFAGTVADVNVQAKGQQDNLETPINAAVTPAEVAAVRAVDGVRSATGFVQAQGVFLVDPAGKVVATTGAPAFGFSVIEEPAYLGQVGLHTTTGRMPTAADEVAVDPKTLERAGYRLGDTVRIATSGAQAMVSAKVVGTVLWGATRSTGGASYIVFDTTTAQRLFTAGKDVFQGVWVTAQPGADLDALARRIGAVLPPSLEAATGTKMTEATGKVLANVTGFISTFLLVFAGIALVVGSFLIVNTFTILVAQRSRELALLRALGASRGQVRRSVLFEAFVIGLVGSTAGLALGLGIARLIMGLFGSMGLDIADTPLTLAPRTVLVTYAVGLVVTLVASYLPSRRAARVPPVAAMTGDVLTGRADLGKRAVVGGLLTAVGAAALLVGLFAESIDNRAAVVGGGALATVLGVAAISPFLGRPVIWAMGRVFRGVYGQVGALAELNAVRNPRRTAATASALMIALTVVTALATLGQSAKTSVDQAIRANLRADYIVQSVGYGNISPSVAASLAKVPGVAAVHAVQFVYATVQGRSAALTAMEPADFDKVQAQRLVAGSLTSFTDRTLLIDEKTARDWGVGVGQSVKATINGTAVDLRIAGLYTAGESGSGMSGGLVPRSTVRALGVPNVDDVITVDRAAGASPPTVRAALDGAVKDLPMVTVADQEEYAQLQAGRINQMLYLIYGLLGLAVVIAILGIVNTLALSVIERTREIGLLRAIGVSRGQVRRMIRLESVVIATLGAVLGIGMGTVFGVALQRALADEGLDRLDLPLAQLGGFLVLAVAVGVLAALWPAYRAARLDVLRAITTE